MTGIMFHMKHENKRVLYLFLLRNKEKYHYHQGIKVMRFTIDS